MLIFVIVIGIYYYYLEIQKYLTAEEALIILGARRTGKSTILLQIIDFLKINPKRILLINLDEPIF